MLIDVDRNVDRNKKAPTFVEAFERDNHIPFLLP